MGSFEPKCQNITSLANAKRLYDCNVLCLCLWSISYSSCLNFFLLRSRRYKRRSVEVCVFRRGWVTLRLHLGWMVTFHAIAATLHNLRLLTQPSRCLLLRSHVSEMIKYRILRHQKIRSQHIKCVNSIPPTQTSQIIHLLVLTTSLEYLFCLLYTSDAADE